MRFLPIFLFALLIAAPIAARAEGPNLLAFSIGEYDVFDDNKAAEFVLEWRGGQPLFWKIVPQVGVMATTDAAVYGFAGLGADLKLTDKIILYPNFAAGAYHNGSGKDLGHGLEFRSALELDYQMDDFSRVGVSLNHISNASLGDSNPGTESILLTYAIPFRW